MAEQEKAEQHVEEASIGSREIEPPTTKRRNGLLPNEQRERLLDRLTEGVRNEIVRYLRQQDDVVLPQENGQYTLNGRARLSINELVARANPDAPEARKTRIPDRGTRR